MIIRRTKKKQARSFLRNSILANVLADGKVSDVELEMLAGMDFTANDVRGILNNSTEQIENLNLSDSDKQKLTDEIMTRLEAYKELNNERKKEQEPQFGL